MSEILAQVILESFSYVLNDQRCAFDFRSLAPLIVTTELPTLHVSTVNFEVQCINLRFKATLAGNVWAKYFGKTQVSTD